MTSAFKEYKKIFKILRGISKTPEETYVKYMRFVAFDGRLMDLNRRKQVVGEFATCYWPESRRK